jgi:hypothetical protein
VQAHADHWRRDYLGTPRARVPQRRRGDHGARIDFVASQAAGFLPSRKRAGGL